MQANIILYIITAILIADFILERVLSYLNARHQQKDLPAELAGIYDQEKYSKSLSYFQVNHRFGNISASFSFLLMLAVILSGAFGKLDEILRSQIQDRIMLSLCFFGVVFIVSDLINLPFSIYKTFVIEEKFGFNKMTVKTFVMDKIKGYILTTIIGGIILYILLYLIINIGENFWWWFWLVISVFLLLINMFYTSLIVPIFNKLNPLPEGELRNRIEEYSKKISFPLDNIFVIDGSKRSSKANAYFSGIGGKKKIVLFDTLISNHTNEELVAVLAHEVGHFKKKHIQTGFILSVLQIGFMLFLLSLFVYNPFLSNALGAEENAIHINLIAFGIMYTPISHLTGILMNIISRKNEYEADLYAATTFNGMALREALKKLSTDNLSNLTPHPAYVFVHYSHPPLLQRLRALHNNS
jgi:STE24 endopeptidase